MKKLIKRVYVDCESRFVSIFQNDDKEEVDGFIFELYSDGLDRLKAECNLAADPIEHEEIVAYVLSHAEPGGAFVIEGITSTVEAVCLTLPTAEVAAERMAQREFEELDEIDEALAESWSKVEKLKNSLLKLSKQVESALVGVHAIVEDNFLAVDRPEFEDLNGVLINQEADILSILNCIRRFQGVKEEKPTHSFLPEFQAHVPYVRHVRARLK